MNDDASPSTSDLPSNVEPNEERQVAVAEEDDEAAILRQNIRMQKGKRKALLEDLIRNIDIMIYCELSVLYYMDCSFLRFLVRAIPEWFYFTPKPAIFPDPPANRPYVGVIFVTNILCILLHTFSSTPEAGEAMRGYLHGGMLIDFVGQLGPVSKVKLVLFDILILVLQVVMLAAALERRSLKKEVVTPAVSGNADANTHVETISATQDLDSEERGILRSDSTTSNDIEMQPLRQSRNLAVRDEDGRADDPLFSHDTIEHPLDVFNAGQHIIVNLYLVDTIRTQWRRYEAVSSDATTLSTSGSTAAAAAAIARRRFGFRPRAEGQTPT